MAGWSSDAQLSEQNHRRMSKSTCTIDKTEIKIIARVFACTGELIGEKTAEDSYERLNQNRVSSSSLGDNSNVNDSQELDETSHPALKLAWGPLFRFQSLNM
jgi:hypothetical protein